MSAGASTASTNQFIAPYSSFGLGDKFINSGFKVICVLDDLTKQAVSYRQLSLLLRRPPGREAFSSDVFYLHSRLLERSAKLTRIEGSLTALPIVETQASDVSSYICTNVISITDGQIFLEGELFFKGQRPAIHFGLSVSRVGSAAQVASMRKVAGSLKLNLAQFREVESFLTMDIDVDEQTASLIRRGLTLIEVLKQAPHTPFSTSLQIALLYSSEFLNYSSLLDSIRKFISCFSFHSYGSLHYKARLISHPFFLIQTYALLGLSSILHRISDKELSPYGVSVASLLSFYKSRVTPHFS